MTAELPQQLGRYEVLEPMGSGSLFVAYRAKSFGVEGFEKTLVLKMLKPEHAQNAELLAAFIERAQQAVRLSHANVVQVFDLGEAEWLGQKTCFMATEHVPGLSMAAVLQRMQAPRRIRVPLELCLFVTSEAAKALDHAHRRRDEQLQPLGIVHGAVSTRNILLSWEGDVKLADFCVSTALRSARGVDDALNRVYASWSPEQAEGEAPTPASDIFGLGVVLYELLGGRNPFLADTAHATLERVKAAAPPPLSKLRPDLPPRITALIEKTLRAKPDQRASSAAEVYDELLAQLYELPDPFGAAEAALYVERLREPLPSVADEIDQVLTRPLSLSPEDVASQLGPSTLPPLQAFANTRHGSVLVLRLGDARPLPAPEQKRAHDILGRYGAEILSHAPDSIAALFGVGSGDDRDSETAVRCGLVLLRSLSVDELTPSIGIESAQMHVDGSGRAVAHELEPVLESAQRMSAAVAGGVAVSQRAARSLRGEYTLSAADGALLVGEPRPYGGKADRFVGRRSELQHLAELLAKASRGLMQVIALIGEQGIGKSRLLAEMERRLGRGGLDVATYVARCPPRGRERPLSGIGAMLRRLCGITEGDPPERALAVEPRLRALGLGADEVDAVLGELGSPRAARHASSGAVMHGAVLGMMQSLSEERFHIFAWDDAHELDPISLEVLNLLTARLKTARVALLFAARPEPGAPYESLPIECELRLGQLDDADGERLVALRAGLEAPPRQLLDFIHRRAGGHPMFIEELTRELQQSGALEVGDGELNALRLDGALGVPLPLRALLANRLRRLPPFERDVFVAAALLDEPARLSVLAAMLRAPEPQVDAAAAALVAQDLVLRERPDTLSFASPLFREVVLSELDAASTAELHLHAAEGYQRALGEALEEEAGRIGYHLAAAGERDRAAEFYATSGLYHLGARRLGRSALELAYALDLADFEQRGGPQVGNWVRALSNAVRHVRSGFEPAGLLSRIVERVTAHPRLDSRLRVQVRIDLGLLVGSLHRYDEAELLLGPISEEASRWPEMERALLAATAELACQQGDYRRALGAIERVKRLARGDSLEQHRLYLAWAESSGAGADHETALSAFVRAERAGTAADPVLAAERARVRALLYADSGEWRAASEAARHAVLLSLEAGLFYHAAQSTLCHAQALLRLDQQLHARAALDEARDLAAQVGSPRLDLQTGMLSDYLDALDEPQLPTDAVRAARARAEAESWTSDVVVARYLLGKLLAQAGRVDEARRELSSGAELAVSTGNRVAADDCYAALADLGL